MANYDFTSSLSPLDFELLSKDLLDAELGIRLENFREGRDKGIDLRYAPFEGKKLIVQCKRYASFASLKSELANKEFHKVAKLKPDRYILTTSAPLSPQQTDELKAILAPFIQSTSDIFGQDRLNSLLDKHPEIERRHIKLWASSAGVLNSILNATTHIVSREEIERTVAAAKIYVRNHSFDEALEILKSHRVCIISGQPGIGKTTLARMLLLYFYERKFDLIKIESDISEARNVGYHNRPRFYYYDDFLGQTAQADKLNKNEDQKLLDFMRSVRESKDSVLVLTTREYILNQARLYYEKLDREKFDHRICIIDLSKYSRRIRAQILYNHLHFSDLPKSHLEAFIAKKGYFQVIDHDNYNPRLIEYLTSATWVGDTPSGQYLSMFVNNLNNPVQIWDHVFRNQLSQRARHLLFVLTTLPTETILVDVETAFIFLHRQQCDKFRLPFASDDFRNAMKELDGTFVGTRKIRDYVVVRFQNPSIRDFMQNLLFGGEFLADMLDALAFFEQAEWFAETLTDTNPQIPLKTLTSKARKVADCLKTLIDVESCSVRIYTMNDVPSLTRQSANSALRISKIAMVASKFNDERDKQWIATRLLALRDKIRANQIWPGNCVEATKTLDKLGYLQTTEGLSLIAALKFAAINSPSDLDDYDALAELIFVLPSQTFTDIELDEIRVNFIFFAESYSTDYITDPEELRDEASKIESISDSLGADTNAVQEALRESAKKMEEEQEKQREWEDDEYRGSRINVTSEVCSDLELDSMFGTL